jgi:hypothetical protein
MGTNVTAVTVTQTRRSGATCGFSLQEPIDGWALLVHTLSSVTGHYDHSGVTVSRPIRAKLPEIYVKVLDPKKIVKLMVIQGVSQRELAEAAWGKDASHSYLGRILRGQIKSIRPEPADRIAHYLGVGRDDLFLARVTTDSARPVKRRRAA